MTLFDDEIFGKDIKTLNKELAEIMAYIDSQTRKHNDSHLSIILLERAIRDLVIRKQIETLKRLNRHYESMIARMETILEDISR